MQGAGADPRYQQPTIVNCVASRGSAQLLRQTVASYRIALAGPLPPARTRQDGILTITPPYTVCQVLS